jgi:hypothetical protein
VHAQFLRRPKLIGFLVLQHGKNEDALELAHRLEIPDAAPVHLQHQFLELFFHGELPKALVSLAVGGVFSRAPQLFGENKHVRCSVSGLQEYRGKGCDIGNALATSSCEEADSVETCTVTAP